MISDVLVTMTQVGMLTFIVASMAAMGLGLTIGQIIEPLRDVRMLLLLLAVNFIVVPIVAVAAARLLPMGDDSATAVIIIGCCAGAPFLPKLALLAKGSPALSVGAMVLLMVVTVIYAPIVVPLVVEGAQVDPWDIASSLILFMLVPLGIGLVIKARYADLADSWVGPVGRSPALPCCSVSGQRCSSAGRTSSAPSAAGSSSVRRSCSSPASSPAISPASGARRAT